MIMRGADMLLAFPSFLLALTILFALGQSLVNVMIAVGISSIPGYTRIVRGSVLSAREHGYVSTARTIGCTDARLMTPHPPQCHRSGHRDCVGRHRLGDYRCRIAVVSRDGCAAADPGMGGHGQRWPAPLRGSWWISVPGLAIVVTVLAINLVGDGLRDALDPKLRNIT